MIRKNLFDQISSEDAVKLLEEGNKRFVTGQPVSGYSSKTIRADLANNGQVPFAAILGCSDSRVPLEIIFDVNAGQIFVVRTAGNVADSIAVGSVEFAVEYLKAKLVVVLGHEKCGAVAAAISGEYYGPNIQAIISEIKPSIDKLSLYDEAENFSGKCEDENIYHTAEKLKKSTVIKKYLDDGLVKVICAKYGLETGKVSFFKD